MAKPIKCILIANTSCGYCMHPIHCDSIAEAVRRGKDGMGYAYRIYEDKGDGYIGKLLRRGFCDDGNGSSVVYY